MCFRFSSHCGISLEVASQIICIVSMVLSSLLLVVYGSAAALVHLSIVRTWSYSSMAAIAGLQLLLGCPLAVGVFRKKPRLLLPWLTCSWFSSGALLTMSVAGTAALLVAGRSDAGASAVMSAYFVYGVLQYYWACVVNSRRHEMKTDYEPTESARSLMGPWKVV